METYEVDNINNLETIVQILHKRNKEKFIHVESVSVSDGYRYIISLTDDPSLATYQVPVHLEIKVLYGDTDSIMCKFKFNRINYKCDRMDTFRLSELCCTKITKELFNRPPIELEFEKVFNPYILLTKKRYIANKYENMKDPFELKCIDHKGIALTRRDYCNLVKKCYSDVIELITNAGNESINITQDLENSVFKSIGLFKDVLRNIADYNVDVQDLVVSAQIGKEYSCRLCKSKVSWSINCPNKIRGIICGYPNVDKSSICHKCKKPVQCNHQFSLGHINLAQDLQRRKEEVNIGDRLQFIYVEREGVDSDQKYELCEDVTYAQEHKLNFNRKCYLDQVTKPMLAFFKTLFLNDTRGLFDNLVEYCESIYKEVCPPKQRKTKKHFDISTIPDVDEI